MESSSEIKNSTNYHTADEKTASFARVSEDNTGSVKKMKEEQKSKFALQEQKRMQPSGSENASKLRFGCFSFRPDLLQFLNTPKFLLLVLSWFSLIQGLAVNGVNNVNVTSYERRFGLSSSKAGLVASFYDITAGIGVVLISYYGTYWNKARMLTAAAISLCLGSFCMALPHFLTSKYELGLESFPTCNANDTICTTGAHERTSNLQNYLYLLLFGMGLHGLGGTTLYSIGVVFIDESVSKDKSPLHLGIFHGGAVLGPALGYVLGAQVLKLYVDFDVVDEVEIQSTDPRWVGAWWLGFIISGCLCLSTVVPMIMGFPRKLPDSQSAKQDETSQKRTTGSPSKVSGDDFGRTLKDFPLALLCLLKNKPFMFLVALGVTEGVFFSGVAVFLPKYIQNQFHQTASFSALATGVAVVPAGALGAVLSGIICSKMQLKFQGMLRLSLVFSILFLPVLFAFLVPMCQYNKMAGINIPYNASGTLQGTELEAACNAGCACGTDTHQPVCSVAKQVEFFSACHAGCKTRVYSRDLNGSPSGKLVGHTDCSCAEQVGQVAVEPFKCEDECLSVYIFLAGAFLMTLCTFMCTPLIACTLRSVSENQRSFAVGVKWVVNRFLGTVLGPLLFGIIIDQTCVVWQEKCDVRGSCWIYDNARTRLYLFLTCLVLKSASVILIIFTMWTYESAAEKAEQRVNETLLERRPSREQDALENKTLLGQQKYDAHT